MKPTRKFLMAASLILTLALASRGENTQPDPNDYVAGIPSDEFVYYAAPEREGRQRQENWCWAACIQMVLNYHGIEIQQEEIVQRIFNKQVDRGATVSEILTALSGWAPDYRRRYSTIHATPFLFSNSQVVRDLANRWPLIVGISDSDGSHHTYVLTAVYYSLDRNNEPAINKVVLRNPPPGSKSQQIWPWRTFVSKLTFAARVYVRRA